MTTHVIVKTFDEKYWEQFGYLYPSKEECEEFVYTLECPEGNGCSGWSECRHPHEVDGVSADGGPYDTEDAPWDGYDEFEFHGELHTWHDWYGWTVPFNGCVVNSNDWEVPDNIYELPAGRYFVDAEWDDEYVYINYVGVEE